MNSHPTQNTELLKKFTKCGYVYKSPAIGDKHKLILSCLHCNEIFWQLENFLEHSVKHLSQVELYTDAIEEDSLDMDSTIIKTENVDCQSEILIPDVVLLMQDHVNRKNTSEEQANDFLDLLPETIKTENIEENEHLAEDENDDRELESWISLKKAKRRKQTFNDNNPPENLHNNDYILGVQHSNVMPRKTVNNDNSTNINRNVDLDDLKDFISEVVDSKLKELKEVITSQNRQILQLIDDNSILLSKLFKVERDVENTILEFPIATVENLQDLENRLQKMETFNRYVAAFKKILYQGNLPKRLKDIFSLEIILDCNYDGIHGKRKFKEFKNVNAALFKAVMADGAKDDDYIKEIRNAFKCIKRAHFKKVSINRSQT